MLALFREVNRHRALVTTQMGDCLRTGMSRYVARHLGGLSLLPCMDGKMRIGFQAV